MKLFALLLALAAWPATSRAEDWTAGDTAREAAFAGVTFLDWQSTRWGLRHGYVEQNPLLGSHPSQRRLDLSVAAAVVGHAIVARLLPRPYREAWQYVGIVVEVSAVVNNTSVNGGVRFSF